jgi:hypothetical protein
MQRLRRLSLIERTVPYLAALVGLVGLAAAVVAELDATARTRDASVSSGALQAAIDSVGQRADRLAATADDGTVEALLALQTRIAKLETDARAAAAAAPVMAEAPAEAAPIEPAGVADLTAPAEPAAKPIDPKLPTTDCIPLGTRFMATPNESYPICQSKTVVKVGAIGADSVSVQGAGEIVETGFATIVGSKCTVMVFSADLEGFAEMRVTCS